MSLTATDRGNSYDTVSGASFGFSPASNCTAGALIVLCLSADNSVTGGASNNITGVTDSLGNNWNARVLSICDNGAANAGVQGGIFTTTQSAGALTTGSTITVTFGTSTAAKAWALNEVTAASGKYAFVVTGGSASQQITSAAPSVTTGSIAVGDLTFGMVAIEGGNSTPTADADTTNGTWSALQNPWTGTSTGGIAVMVQTKVQTTTASTQTYNPTLAATRDLVASWLQVREVAPKTLALAGVG